MFKKQMLNDLSDKVGRGTECTVSISGTLQVEGLGHAQQAHISVNCINDGTGRAFNSSGRAFSTQVVVAQSLSYL